MSAAQGRFVDWVRKEIGVVAEEGGVRKFELYHTVEGEFRNRIATHPYDQDAQTYDGIAQTIWDDAEQDAETYSGRPQRYAVLCFRKDEEPYSQCAFRITPASTRQMMLMGDDSEPSNERGVVGQQLRHTEGLFRLLTVSASDFQDRVLTENRRLHEALEKSQSTQIDFYGLLEDLNERRHVRKLEADAAERKAAQHEKLMGLLMTLAPALLAQVFQNRAPMAEKAYRDDALIGFLSNLSEEELAGAFSALKPQNQVALAEIYKSARAAAPNDAAQPKNDSGGAADSRPEGENHGS